MKTDRKLITRKCLHCGDTFADPLTIFRLPDELELLATSLTLPAERVTAMLDRGTIKIRRAVDDDDRPHGPLLVLLADAFEAVEGLQKNIL